MRIQGLSTQLIECVRIARMLSKHGEKFLQRVYSPDEIQLCQVSKHSTQMFAAYWACKEAILKMLGVEDRDRFDWREVEIVWLNGRNQAILKGSLAEKYNVRRISELWLSYSYTRNYASATVLSMQDDHS
ncbi:holo-ACP synthase [Telmatocola sphagniphila]|nr:holo-ACP synthase [Telmatocola sphagniphila]